MDSDVGRWEEQTVAEGARKTPPVGLVAHDPEPETIDQKRASLHVDLGDDDDDDEPTVRADSEHHRLATGTGEATVDEPTVEDQARPLPPLSVVPPVPKQRNKPRTADARLAIIAGNDTGREITLEGKRITIGRGVDNDVVLTDIAVSRKHLEIDFDGAHYSLRDLGSGNGTLLNERIEDGVVELRHDDRFEIGNTVFRVDHPASKVNVRQIGFGGQASDVDEEASTIAGRRKSTARPVAKLPPPKRAKTLSRPPPVPASPTNAPPVQAHHARPGALPSAPPGASVEAAGAPLVIGANNNIYADPTLPPAANLMMPGYPHMRANTFQVGNDRKLVIGLVSASLVVVLLAIGVLLFRGDDGTGTTATTGATPGVVASNSAAKKGASDTAVAAAPLPDKPKKAAVAKADAAEPDKKSTDEPDKKSTAEADKKRPVATLPASTWGTDERTLVARAGVGSAPINDPPTSDDATDKKATTNKATTKEAPEKATKKPQPKSSATANKATRVAARKPAPRKPRNTFRSPTARRVAARRKRVAATTNRRRTSTVAVTAAKRRAAAAYRKRSFTAAANMLRNAAKSADTKNADALRSLATNYEAVGANMTRAQGSEKSSPTVSMGAYRRALRLDQRVGRGAHSPYIRIKLGSVAPRAAASYMAQKRYEAAKKACDAAVNYGAGSHRMVRRVRATLQRMAGQLYRKALGMRKSNPNGAKRLWRRVLKMVPPDSPWYARSYKLLNTRKRARDDDE